MSIRVAVLENGTWSFTEGPAWYEVCRAALRGLVEIIPLRDSQVFLAGNEEARCLEMRPTALWLDPETGEAMDTLCGPLVAFGPEDENGEFTSITDDALEALKSHLEVIPEEINLPTPEPVIRVFALR